MRIKSFKNFISESEEETYSFSELSPEAKKNALDNNRDINVDYEGWSDPVIEGFKEDMEEIGIGDLEVYYTGFYSQGDGASFTTDYIDSTLFLNKMAEHDTEGLKKSQYSKTPWYLSKIDLEKKGAGDYEDLIGDLTDIGIKTKGKVNPENIKISVVSNDSRYSHENTVEAEVELEDTDDLEWSYQEVLEFESDLASHITSYIRNFCKQLYRSLSKDYDMLTSDESVQETIEANDYRFDEEGNLA